MIDEKTLAKWEQNATDSDMLGYAEAFRQARRYLALREHGVLMGMPHNMTLAHDEKLDAAADRLLGGGE